MNTRLIGISGKARAGKDTLANFLVNNHMYAKYSFASPLKNAANDIFGWDTRHSDGFLKEEVDPEFGVSPRYVYQTLGTDWGRKMICDDVWLRVAAKHISKFGYVVIPDVRFDNEADFILSHGGVLVNITRDDQITIASSGHISEQGLDKRFDRDTHYVYNIGGSLDRLEEAAKYLALKADQKYEFKRTSS